MQVDASRPGRWRVLFTETLNILNWLTSREQLPESPKPAPPDRGSKTGFFRWLSSRDELPLSKPQDESHAVSALEILINQDKLPEPNPDNLTITQNSLLRHFLKREVLQTLEKEKFNGAR